MVPLGWTLGTSGEPASAPSDGREFKAHVCYAVTPPASIITPSAEHVKQAWKPWDKILRKLSAEEQLAQLCSAFDVWILKDAFMGSEFESRLPDFIKNAKVGMVVQQQPQQFQPQQGQQWQQQPGYQQPQQMAYPQQPWGQPQQPMMQQQPQQAQQPNWAPQQPAAPAQPFGNPFDMGGGHEEERPYSPPQQPPQGQPQYPQQIQPPAQAQSVTIPTGAVNQTRLNDNLAALQGLVNRRPTGN